MVPIMIKFISMWSVFTGVFPHEERHPASHSDRGVWFVHQTCDREEKHCVLLNCVVIQVFYRELFCANHINCWGASSLKQKRNHSFKVSKLRVTLISTRHPSIQQWCLKQTVSRSEHYPPTTNLLQNDRYQIILHCFLHYSLHEVLWQNEIREQFILMCLWAKSSGLYRYIFQHKVGLRQNWTKAEA